MTMTGGHPPNPFRRRPVINGNLALIAGQPWTAGLHYFVLLAAAGVDLVTFKQVLGSAVNEDDVILWIMVVGFTAVCLALSHNAGSQAKVAVTGHVVGARAAAIVSFAGWLALGASAFVFRLFYAGSDLTGGTTYQVEGQTSNTLAEAAAQERQLSAFLFLALYLGTGIVAGVAGYVRHHPEARQYLRALSRRTKAAAEFGRFDSKVKSVAELRRSVQDARDDHERAWLALEARCRAAAERLKKEIEFELFKKNGQIGTSDQRPQELTGTDTEPEAEEGNPEKQEEDQR
ncbi:hypothetical protein ABZ345_08660 [Lentzea sp. NPDC005914]|uniref:hypothetical protein n=1 Tax=Lentzea sp. NPDC005914 TaxID=3154572 RepID=UPI0033EF6866